MTPTDGTPLPALDQRTPTLGYHAPRRPFQPARSEERLLTAERQLAAAQDELTGCRAALAAEHIGHALTERLYLAELSNSLRLQRENAALSELVAAAQMVLRQVSLDNLHLRHQIAGTTPVAVLVALAQDEETEVMDDPDAGGVR